MMLHTHACTVCYTVYTGNIWICHSNTYLFTPIELTTSLSTPLHWTQQCIVQWSCMDNTTHDTNTLNTWPKMFTWIGGNAGLGMVELYPLLTEQKCKEMMLQYVVMLLNQLDGRGDNTYKYKYLLLFSTKNKRNNWTITNGTING